MTHHKNHRELATLEEIRADVGDNTYRMWDSWARAKLKQSQFRNKTAEAQHSFIYEDILSRYNLYQKTLKDTAKSEPYKINWLESWGGANSETP